MFGAFLSHFTINRYHTTFIQCLCLLHFSRFNKLKFQYFMQMIVKFFSFLLYFLFLNPHWNDRFIDAILRNMYTAVCMPCTIILKLLDSCINLWLLIFYRYRNKWAKRILKLTTHTHAHTVLTGIYRDRIKKNEI